MKGALRKSKNWGVGSKKKKQKNVKSPEAGKDGGT